MSASDDECPRAFIGGIVVASMAAMLLAGRCLILSFMFTAACVAPEANESTEYALADDGAEADEAPPLETLFAELFSDKFQTRQKASRRLYEMCVANPELRKELRAHLATKPPLEVVVRLRDILQYSQQPVPWAEAAAALEQHVKDADGTRELLAAQGKVAAALSKSDLAMLEHLGDRIEEVGMRNDFDFRRPPGRLLPPIFDFNDREREELYTRRGEFLASTLEKAGLEAGAIGEGSDFVLVRIGEVSFGLQVDLAGQLDLFRVIPHTRDAQHMKVRPVDVFGPDKSLPPLPPVEQLPEFPAAVHAEWRAGQAPNLRIRTLYSISDVDAPNAAAAYFAALYPGLKREIFAAVRR